MSRKKSITAKSTADELDSGEYPKRYPKRFEIVVDRHPEDPTKVLVTRTCDNMSGFELYGLLQVVLRAVEMQITFPEIRRSDGYRLEREE
jgi:hypothetical protein